MKTSELEGALLDYWVAQAMGLTLPDEWNESPSEGILIQDFLGELNRFSPSTDWADGGPIIEREEIGTWKEVDEWTADYGDPVEAIEVRAPHGTGPTPLIAAMRAFVASKFGPEVPDVE